MADERVWRRKFESCVYINEDGWAKDFELVIQWLADCGLCHKVGCVDKGDIPLQAYRDIPAFKLHLVDVGLLAVMTALDTRVCSHKARCDKITEWN